MSGHRLAPERRRWPLRLAAAVAGVLLALVFPEAGLWWWAYVGLVPLLLLVRSAPDRREALWRTWFGACGFFLTLYHWLLPSLSVFAVPVALVMAVAWLPWGWAGWWLLRPPTTPGRAAAAVAVVPSVWVLVEYARSWHLLGGSWGFLGLSQWQVRPVLAVAALGGVWALSLLLVSTNVALAVALAPQARGWVRLGAVGFAGVLVGAALTYGLARPDPGGSADGGGSKGSPDAGGSGGSGGSGELTIGASQPGVVHDPVERFEENERITRELVATRDDLDLVVWGQSSVGFDLGSQDWARERLLALADEAGVPVVVNQDAKRPDGRISKVTIVVDPEEGLTERYVKQRLVPFGEYIPLRPVFGWVERFTEAANEDRLPGTGLTTFELAGHRVGPLISYESTFPDMRRTLAREGVEMTLVQGAATTFQGTWALPQQASFEAVRAVESGRPTVLVSVSGTSASFDPRGRQLAWVSQDRTGGWVVEVPLSQEDTPFVRWGNWVTALCLVVVVSAAAVALLRRGTPPGTRAPGRSGHR